MESRTWVVALALAIGPLGIAGCESDSGEAGTSIPGTEVEGASEEVEREHPGLERTEQPIPASEGRDDDEDWGTEPAMP